MEFKEQSPEQNTHSGSIEKSQEELRMLKKIRETLVKVGLNPNLLEPKIIDRLVILNKSSEIFDDENRAVDFALKIFEYYKNKKGEEFSPTEKNTILIGTLFSDIGKTGPENASKELMECISTIYSSDYHPGKIVTTEEFLEYIVEDKRQRERYIALLQKEIGLNTKESIGKFFSLHSTWTYDILTKHKAGIPFDAITAAASHHKLENQNPAGVTELTKESKIIILLDKYDAHRKRNGSSHEETISWLYKYIEEKCSGEEKLEFDKLITDIDSALFDDKSYDGLSIEDNNEFKPLTS